MFLGIRLTSWRLLENTIIFRLSSLSWRIRLGTTAWWICQWQRTFCDIIFSKTKRLQYLGSSIGFFYNFDTFLEFQHLEFSLLKIKRSETELESLTWMFTYIFHATQTFAEICTWLVPSATEKTTSEIFWRPRHATFFEEFWNINIFPIKIFSSLYFISFIDGRMYEYVKKKRRSIVG